MDERLDELRRHDFASALLELKVCDPAMGSGHFLVRLVDYLADKVIEALADAPKEVTFGEYKSPLADRIDKIRKRILAEAQANGWAVREEQLEDRMIVRRMVLKRAVFGVDKNPMAVELAKVSLWLHTFTVGAPLSFLDHHLRVGDSLFGEWVRKASDDLSEKAGIFMHGTVVHARQAARMMLDIETAADADLAEVRKSAEAFDGVREATDPLIALLSFWHACRWLPNTPERRSTKDLLLRGAFGDPVGLLTGKQQITVEPGQVSKQQAAELLNASVQLAEQERFLHWEVAFPGVWADWESAEPQGGFDAVIGNPPWDHLKLDEVKWFAAHQIEIARAQRKADRQRMIEQLRKDNDPLYPEYELVRERAETALNLARRTGEYPLLGRGDINLYSLFVERSLKLIHPNGFVGLLTPIGIGTDKTASTFFSSMADAKRVLAFLSFENRGGWLFEDVHHEDQPTVFVVGGQKRESEDFAFGVKLHAVPDDAYIITHRLTAAECRSANPNTGTIPIFRSSRDTEITAGIYDRLPILGSSSGNAAWVWPVRYATIFHMTSKSWMFRKKEELEEIEKAFPIGERRWKNSKTIFEPLFEGKMVSIFNHRYASVGINPKSVSGQGVPIHSTLEQLSDPNFVNQPRYWVPQQSIRYDYPYALCFNDVCNTNNERSLISAIVPQAGYGNTLPILVPDGKDKLPSLLYLTANFNALICDYVARQKIQSRHLNKYILEQLPIVPEDAYARKFGARSAADIVRDHVLRLSYTAHDLAEFARDLGHVDKKSGEVLPPFKWDEEERAHLRARLDALYFLLYGITDRDDVRYILDTFPIVKRDDEKAFGRYRTAELILAYMNALDAGDSETRVAL